MSPHGDQDRTGEQAFAAISHQACPPLAETLLAVVAAWRPVDHTDLDGQLDQLARGLFARRAGRPRARRRAGDAADARVPRRPQAGGRAVARRGARHAARPRGDDRRRGGRTRRRAGWEISVCSTPTAWYAGLLDDGVLWLIDPTGAADGVPTMVRRHCAHELAYVVLTGLAERFERPRDRAHARTLRDRLALFEAPERPGDALLGALWNGTTPR